MLKEVWRSLLWMVGLSPARESEALVGVSLKLERELEELLKQVRELEEENKSLWNMLDELQGSNTIDPKTVTDFIEELKDTVMDQMLKDFKPAGEA